jgi:hypothetical protein
LTPKLFRLAFLLSLALAALTTATASAQTAVRSDTRTTEQQATPTANNDSSRTTADETFDLNINERRIVESNFEASTSVEIGDEQARGLNLRVGVALGAREIEVLLRNVRGRVRFRGSLESILQRLNLRRPAAPTSGVAPP